MCVYICACVFLCLCSNLFSYVLQCVQWILYTLPHRCSLLHHSFMFWFEYNTSVHCVKTYRSRLKQWPDRRFFQLITTQLMPAVFSLFFRSRAASTLFFYLLLLSFLSLSLSPEQDTMKRKCSSEIDMNLTALFFSFRFIHSFIPVHKHRTRRGEGEQGGEKRHPPATNRDWKDSFLLFLSLSSSSSSALFLLHRIRRIYGRRKDESIMRIFYSDPNCWSSDLVVV